MVNYDCIFHSTVFNGYYTEDWCEALTHMECEGCVYFKSIKDYEWCEYFNPVGNKVPGVRKRGE